MSFINEHTIYGIGLAILMTIFFEVIAKMIFDDPICVGKTNMWLSGSTDEEYKRCEIINEKSRIRKIIFLMVIVVTAMIGSHYIKQYHSLHTGLGLSALLVLLTTMFTEWRNNSNTMNALLSGIGIVTLGLFSIKNLK